MGMEMNLTDLFLEEIEKCREKRKDLIIDIKGESGQGMSWQATQISKQLGGVGYSIKSKR